MIPDFTSIYQRGILINMFLLPIGERTWGGNNFPIRPKKKQENKIPLPFGGCVIM